MREEIQVGPGDATKILMLGDFRAVNTSEEAVQGCREIREVSVDAHFQEKLVFLIGIHPVIEWQLVVPERVSVNLKMFYLNFKMVSLIFCCKKKRIGRTILYEHEYKYQ